jgi:SAM-dependent methyltransferase
MDTLRNRRVSEAFRPYDLTAPGLQPYRRAARMLLVRPEQRLLVAGAGFGQGAWLLARLGGDVTGVGGGVSVAAARHRYGSQPLERRGHLHYAPADLATWWPAPEYDAVVAIDLLEHYAPGEGAALLRRLLHALRPGATGLFLHLPTSAPLLHRLQAIRQRARPRDANTPRTDQGHTLGDAVRLVREAGGRMAQVELRVRRSRLRPLESSFGTMQPGALRLRAAAQLVTDFDAVVLPELDAVLRRTGDLPPD